MFSLSTVWGAQDTDNGHRIVAESKQLGFDCIELHHSLKTSTVKQILDEKEAGNISISSLHNYCPAVPTLGGGQPLPEPYSLSSLDTVERNAAIKNTANTLQFASKFEAPVVILHCGWLEDAGPSNELARMYKEGQRRSDKYKKLKERFLKTRQKKGRRHLDKLYLSLESLLEAAVKENVKLAIENRYSPGEIPDFDEIGTVLNKFESEHLGYWHDTGHAQTVEELGITPHKDYLEAYKDKLLGVHLHDAVGIFDHKVPLTGTFDFAMLKPYLQPDTIKVLEVFVAATDEEFLAGIAHIKELLG